MEIIKRFLYLQELDKIAGSADVWWKSMLWLLWLPSWCGQLNPKCPKSVEWYYLVTDWVYSYVHSHWHMHDSLEKSYDCIFYLEYMNFLVVQYSLVWMTPLMNDPLFHLQTSFPCYLNNPHLMWLNTAIWWLKCHIYLVPVNTPQTDKSDHETVAFAHPKQMHSWVVKQQKWWEIKPRFLQ